MEPWRLLLGLLLALRSPQPHHCRSPVRSSRVRGCVRACGRAALFPGRCGSWFCDSRCCIMSTVDTQYVACLLELTVAVGCWGVLDVLAHVCMCVLVCTTCLQEVGTAQSTSTCLAQHRCSTTAIYHSTRVAWFIGQCYSALYYSSVL